MSLWAKFSCDGCGLVDHPVKLTPRLKEQGVVAWMQQATEEVSAAHAFISPTCPATHLKDLKIPVDGVERIGDAP